MIARGQALFGINCKACHGSDLRGGDLGGPNLLRSQLVLGDQNGEAIVPVIQKGRPPANGGPPMPAFPLPRADDEAIAEYIHSVLAKKANQGGPPPEPEKPLDILVGNPARGRRYFAAHCASCHSVDADLKGIASRATSPMNLQDSWVAGRKGILPDGQSDPNPEKSATIPASLVSPFEGGVTNYQAAAFNPKTGLFYTHESTGFNILCFDIHPGEDLHDGVTFERFLATINDHPAASILYDPSHFVLQQLDYVSFIDHYHSRIKAFHVKDAEFHPNGKIRRLWWLSGLDRSAGTVPLTR